MKTESTIPLSLYIHFPWCAKKCPYCDFVSHAAGCGIDENRYIETLCADLQRTLPFVQHRKLISIFIGGGTPSLLSARTIEKLLNHIEKEIPFQHNIEITLECNPGTVNQQKLKEFRHAGVNRLSIGIQSFQDAYLKKLGRIHNGEQAKKTFADAQRAGFDNINVDIMHGLPNQTLHDALNDVETLIHLSPQHISWYELTIEPNTPFGKNPPTLPDENTLADIQQAGHALLCENNFNHYEISAYCQQNYQCRHNLNYWQFGDYLGIGAGAHEKITDTSNHSFNIIRYQPPHETTFPLLAKEIPLEFMLNALRLTDGFSVELFEERTGLSIDTIAAQLKKARSQGFIQITEQRIIPTPLGLRFLDTCLESFIPSADRHLQQ